MELLIALLLIAAVVLAVIHALGASTRINLGWLAIACVIAAVWAIPAVASL